MVAPSADDFGDWDGLIACESVVNYHRRRRIGRESARLFQQPARVNDFETLRIGV